MRHVTLTLTFDELLHPVFDCLTDGELVTHARMIHWDVRHEDRATLLFYGEGNADRFADRLAAIPAVSSFDVTRLGDDRWFLYLRERGFPLERELFEIFTRDSLLVVPPLRYPGVGEVQFDVLGDAPDLQTAIDALPDAVRVRVDSVGGYEGSVPLGLEPALTNRQRAAIDAAVDLGYYETPRRATHEDVADRLECAPSTASEHLQKAEAAVITAFAERTGRPFVQRSTP